MTKPDQEPPTKIPGRGRLDIDSTIERMRSQYLESPTRHKTNILVVGDFGTGKTSLARTCPKPVLIHSFDPGGPRVSLLQEDIKKGNILVEEFAGKDEKGNLIYPRYAGRFDQLKSGGFFERMGTYFVDSLTTLSDAAMNHIMAKAGRLGGVPQLQDYMIQQNLLRDYCKEITDLPCTVVVTGHLDYKQDEVSGQIHSGVMISGKLSVKLPLLFDEVYVALAKEGPRKATGEPHMHYKLQTNTDGKMRARTRIGGDTFLLLEEPDIEYLMVKAGLLPNSRPKPKEEKGEANGKD